MAVFDVECVEGVGVVLLREDGCIGAAETMLAAVIRARGRKCLFMGCSLCRVGWEAV